MDQPYFDSHHLRPRTRRRRANWPYRFTWLALLLAVALYVGVQMLLSAYALRDWQLALVASLLDATLAVWFFAVGASIGSFLNVVVYRLPAGRSLGGYSKCPFCTAPIAGSDNIPILAWIKLRGRCRTCRLPISIQYPLVEGLVAVLFLTVYVTEVASSGGNLPLEPRAWQRANAGGLEWPIPVEQVLRVSGYLAVLSGLVAAALIAWRKVAVPISMFAWMLLPLTAVALYEPQVVVVPWRDAQPVGSVEARLDVIATLLCGAVAGMALARVLIPVLYPGFDRSLIARDRRTTQARQSMAAMAVVGVCLGWQSLVSCAWVIMLAALLGGVSLRYLSARGHTRFGRGHSRLSTSPLVTDWRGGRRLRGWVWSGWGHSLFRSGDEPPLADMTVWCWIGLLLFRANWERLYAWQPIPEVVPEVIRHIAGALALAPLAWLLRKNSQPFHAPQADHEVTVDPSPQDSTVRVPVKAGGSSSELTVAAPPAAGAERGVSPAAEERRENAVSPGMREGGGEESAVSPGMVVDSEGVSEDNVASQIGGASRSHSKNLTEVPSANPTEKSMQIWPAIDLLGGKCVRLQQGDYQRETVFADDPAEMAAKWKAAGTKYLHLVDLDGAKDGSQVNGEVIQRIVQQSGLTCQVGGGVRDEATIERLLNLGLQRVIVGTRALRDPEWFAQMAEQYPRRLVLGIDARDGMVATDGWLETSTTPAVELAQRIAKLTDQVAAIVYTDIARDGMLSGPNFEQLAEMQRATEIPVVASGGVTTLDDIRRLQSMRTHAAIVGRALYDGKLDLRQVLDLCPQ